MWVCAGGDISHNTSAPTLQVTLTFHQDLPRRPAAFSVNAAVALQRDVTDAEGTKEKDLVGAECCLFFPGFMQHMVFAWESVSPTPLLKPLVFPGLCCRSDNSEGVRPVFICDTTWVSSLRWPDVPAVTAVR